MKEDKRVSRLYLATEKFVDETASLRQYEAYTRLIRGLSPVHKHDSQWSWCCHWWYHSTRVLKRPLNSTLSTLLVRCKMIFSMILTMPLDKGASSTRRIRKKCSHVEGEMESRRQEWYAMTYGVIVVYRVCIKKQSIRLCRVLIDDAVTVNRHLGHGQWSHSVKTVAVPPPLRHVSKWQTLCSLIAEQPPFYSCVSKG